MPPIQPEGFLAAPASEPGGAVLVLHPWWGLNDTMRSVCTRLAESGFVAFAPDLYHGAIATDVERAEALVTALDGDRARAEVAEAAAFLRERSGRDQLAVVGFSLGAFFALELSVSEPDRVHAVVLFYGTGRDVFAGAKARYLGHFAETDPFESRAQVDRLEDALREAGRPVDFHHYADTGHWFFEPDREDAFRPAAAALAWERTLTFLNGERGLVS